MTGTVIKVEIRGGPMEGWYGVVLVEYPTRREMDRDVAQQAVIDLATSIRKITSGNMDA